MLFIRYRLPEIEWQNRPSASMQILSNVRQKDFQEMALKETIKTKYRETKTKVNRSNNFEFYEFTKSTESRAIECAWRRFYSLFPTIHSDFSIVLIGRTI